MSAHPVGKIDRRLVADLEAVAPGACTYDVDLSQMSRWRVGGPLSVLIEPANAKEVSEVLSIMHHRPEPFCVVGDTSNVLFDSKGFPGVIMRVGSRMGNVSISGTSVRAQAGAAVPAFVRQVGSSGLTGIEHAVGIPGSLGGLVVMNGGSQRKGIGQHVTQVTACARNGETVIFDHDDCRFGYRSSALQDAHLVVVEVTLELASGDPRTIAKDMDAIEKSRSVRFPSSLPNCGSTFLSDPQMYAVVGPPGAAIEAAGLKGIRYGQAQISDQHANFIINLGGATSAEVLRLIALARTCVEARTGYRMDCEVRHISPEGLVRPAHEVALRRWPISTSVDAKPA